ncbi:DMT family transporter [Rossellomorea sp. YZS02]|uniref:DMT family transporter n=1 Tax=Rossellomorea sp. YZS02 TaxID=3097358 RepID=UPI002A162232|nr:DMT family transporter [Rossellomorea sp. YZS02]MDX8342219.1 DMT family transporter [Rossellomorea sp. YZS02]
MTKLLFGFCTLIWGLNFIAVKIQGEPVPLELSLFYRLIITTLLFALLLFVRKPFYTLEKKDYLTVILFGLCNFAWSYLFLYYGTIMSTAAIVTMIYSLKVVLTPVALALVKKEPMSIRLGIGGALGIIAVFLLLFPTLMEDPESLSMKGILFALTGTIITSIGDVCSSINADRGINPVYSNVIGFTAASIFLGTVISMQDTKMTFPAIPSYWMAVVYLSLFASFFAWLFYLKLVSEMGAGSSGYMVALFPAVGGAASVIIGETELSVFLVVGCLMSCVGALIALKANKKQQPKGGKYRWIL